VVSFPQTRLRRTRAADWSRRLVREAALSADDLIWPLFVTEGKGVTEPVASMPGVTRFSVDLIVKQAAKAVQLGIPALALFPRTPEKKKTPNGDEALNSANLVNRAARAIKKEVPGIGVIVDVALDPYTSHGHDGLLKNGVILNDATLKVLAKQAVVQAEAGADIVAPSDMMDGRVGVIRAALDQKGFTDVQIMAYAAKYASAFYGPFREAVGSKGVLTGDKRTYQMDPGNSDEALREVSLDIEEGADSVIVKPGLPYLDIVRRVRETFHIPVFAYQVSGEYAMLHAAAKEGWLDLEKTMMETLTAFKRAGASGVLTYFAPEAARLLKGA
jgi:porphobilinogen synthase